jgi:hypothetical protein
MTWQEKPGTNSKGILLFPVKNTNGFLLSLQMRVGEDDGTFAWHNRCQSIDFSSKNTTSGADIVIANVT